MTNIICSFITIFALIGIIREVIEIRKLEKERRERIK